MVREDWCALLAIGMLFREDREGGGKHNVLYIQYSSIGLNTRDRCQLHACMADVAHAFVQAGMYSTHTVMDTK